MSGSRFLSIVSSQIVTLSIRTGCQANHFFHSILFFGFILISSSSRLADEVRTERKHAIGRRGTPWRRISASARPTSGDIGPWPAMQAALADKSSGR
jgi:hypothetical protein